MILFSFIRNCILCGRETDEQGDICIICKEATPLINGSVCSKCGIPLVSESINCLRCRVSEFHFDYNRSIFEYKSVAKDIFYHYKFANNKIIGRWYAQLLFERISKSHKDYLVVPSPGSYFKKVKKGWDQVELLCSFLKKDYGLSIHKSLGKRSGFDQKKLDLEGRRNNLKNRIVFKGSKNSVKNRDILLIDDIFTTGATASECSRILKENGAIRVCSLTLAID